MRKTMVAAALVVLGAMAVAWAQPGPPQPGPEHKRLAYFAGGWDFTGQAKESPMGPGGAVTFKETCELMDGGFALICRSEGKGPMGPSKSFSIMSYDADKKAYTYTAAENNMPVFTALGQVSSDTWTWLTESSMGGKPMKTRVVIKEAGPTAYDFTMELSADGAPFARVIEGKSTRSGT